MYHTKRNRVVLIGALTIVMLLLLALSVITAFADTAGPRIAGTGANVTFTGSDVNWSNPGNITASDDNRAQATIASSGNQTAYLEATNFGFTIPSGSTINGIQVAIERSSVCATSCTSSVTDNEIRIIKGGAVQTTDRSSGTAWPTTDTVANYGTTSDLWGTTWTYTDTNASTFGVAIVATRGGGGDRIARVDAVTITVSYTPPKANTTTSVSCASPITYGSSSSCTVTVTRASGSNTPTGNVSWITSGAGSFVTSPCALSGSGGTATCSVSYTPSAVGTGTHVITATYAGDTNFNGSSGNQSVAVNKATPTLSVGNSPVTYNGSPQAATVNHSVAGVVSNVQYDGSATVPTNANTYAVTANFTPTDSANYNSLTNASAGNFVINKANPTLSVTNSPVTYDGSPHAATVDGSVPGVASNILTGGSATQTNANTYAVTANFAPTDSTNYNSLTGASAGNFVINKATPTLSVTNSPVTYNGAQQAATLSSSVLGVISNIQYDGSATAPTNVGTYAVTANFAPTDSTNYNNLTNATAGNFVINKATPTVSVTNSPVTYNGSPQAAAVSGSVGGNVSNVQYDGSATAPTDAGTYAVTADFAPTDSANYNSLTNASAGDFVIDKATPTLSVINSPVTYDGSSHAASLSSSVVGAISNVQYDGSATAPTDAGTYAVTADFAPNDTANYNSLTDASAGNFVIDQATPTLSVTNSPVTYDGSQQLATLSSSVLGAISNIQYDGSATAPTNVGTYAVTANFAPTDSTNYNSLTDASAGNFAIDQAASTTTVTGGTFTYDGSPHAATVSVTGAGGLNLSPAPTYSGGCSAAPINVAETTPTACTASYTFAGDANHLGSSGSDTVLINQASATISLSNLNQTYDGTPKSAIASTTPPSLTVDLTYDGSPTAPTNAGSYAVDATVTDPNYTGTASDTLVIAPADTTVSLDSAPNPSVSGASVTFTATVAPSAASGTVQFYADGSALDGPAALSSGSASIDIASLSAGIRAITATYSGDGNFNPSNSTPLAQIVQPTLVVNVAGSGSVTKEPDLAAYSLGQVVTLTATPDTGWSFTGWSGDLSGIANPETITMNGDKVVTATFTQIEYTLTTNTVGSGSINKDPNQATYHYGDVVTVTAVPSLSWDFTAWSGDVTGGNNPETVLIDGNKSITATFTQNAFALTINTIGSGSVVRNPDQASFPLNTVVTLTATPAPGWSFTGWSGDLSGSVDPTTITMDSDKVVTATFTQNEYTLATNVVGSGSVLKNPNQATYHYGDVVTVTATPTAGWSFTGWSGNLSGNVNPTTILIAGNRVVTATFSQSQYTLTVNLVGSGTVAKNPNQATYHFGDVVTVTATPSAGWAFAGWSGALSGSVNPTTITMDANKVVTATFTQIPYTLTTNTVGSGSVNKNPNQGTYHFGDVVTVTAVPLAGWSFTGWTGDLSGSLNPAPITINGNKVVTATFTQNNPLPSLTSLNPISVTAGSGAFTLTVNGTGFIPASVVQWDGANRVTTYVSSTKVLAAITALDVLAQDTINVTVVNPAPGGGPSNALPFTISPSPEAPQFLIYLPLTMK